MPTTDQAFIDAYRRVPAATASRQSSPQQSDATSERQTHAAEGPGARSPLSQLIGKSPLGPLGAGPPAPGASGTQTTAEATPTRCRAAAELYATPWPAMAERLYWAAGAELARLIDRLTGDGARVLALAGVAPKAGVTTAAIALARTCSAAGMRSTLVGANPQNAGLARALGARPSQTLTECIGRGDAYGEALVSWPDARLALAEGGRLEALPPGACEELVASSDLVVIDMGVVTQRLTHGLQPFGKLETRVALIHSEGDDARDIDHARKSLEGLGIGPCGLIEVAAAS
ncbi:hypothetical protein Mal64_02510 [Pseudobythopirellula maris]|uniref:Uncharacterized protein n=1 Tax=Pseudobythopirellula maris TaxID=2527991 RepID=A0A5C5ZQV9_9BACT|nr:CpsD/CapB family tyrosine-protein kinase [Pseudobythopirellula maris]TWT89869.1 hypothetical protein Mal64_02510 [Pseudobythopirellula maris]